MNRKKNYYIQQLIKNNEIATDDQFVLFEEAVSNLADLATGDDIPLLCKAFNDFTECPEVIFGLVHLIESLERSDRYVDLAIQGVLENMHDSPGWSKRLIKRILNNGSSRNRFKKTFLNLDSTSRGKMTRFLEEIRKDDPEVFGEEISDVTMF